MKKILILGGTGEAVSLAEQFRDQLDISVIYSLAGRTRSPTLPDCEIRQGGFGGVEGLTRFLHENDIAAVIDATHPYAKQMASNALHATTETSLPYYKFLRPAWLEPEQAPWIRVSSADEAAEKIQGRFGRVFLSSGLNDVAAFAALTEVWFLVRSIEEPSPPISLPNFSHIKDRGPFNEDGERALFLDHKIDVLVSKNSGGAATEAKLKAAYSLSIPVIMINRPKGAMESIYDNPLDLVRQLRKTL
ncbi:MAG: cobalt-precorrin-6A reductase [Alphaproteobacteria bacterium]